MLLKTLIKNTEARILVYKDLLAQVSKDKINFPPNDDSIEWYKSHLREMKNFEQSRLKSLVEERTFENEELNPPFCYNQNKTS